MTKPLYFKYTATYDQGNSYQFHYDIDVVGEYDQLVGSTGSGDLDLNVLGVDEFTAVVSNSAAYRTSTVSAINTTLGSTVFTNGGVLRNDGLNYEAVNGKQGIHPTLTSLTTLSPSTTDLVTLSGNTVSTTTMAAAGQTLLACSQMADVVNALVSDVNALQAFDNGLAKTFSAPSRSLNSAFQISTAKDAFVSYSVPVTSAATLVLGSRGRLTLQYADNSAMTTNLVTLVVSEYGIASGLVVTGYGTVQVSGVIPKGKYVRLVTANVAGTPTFGSVSAQEVLM